MNISELISSDRLLFRTSEQKANSVANGKRTAVDRLFWNFSNEVYFLCFFVGDSLGQESHLLWKFFSQRQMA